MGTLGRLFAPVRETRLRQVREIAERETYKAFVNEGFSEEEAREEARSIADELDDNLRGRRRR